MKNIEVIKAFLMGCIASTEHVTTDGTRLWSYNTCIGEKSIVDGKVVLIMNLTKYSQTTSHHQSLLTREVPVTYNVLYTNKMVPRNSQHLTEFI